MGILEKILDKLYTKLEQRGKIDENIKSVHPEAFFPYDLVVVKEEYDKLILQGLSSSSIKPIIGTILGIDKYDKTDKGIIPTIVRVFYFNMLNPRYPIIRSHDTKDLKFISSPLKDLVTHASLMNEMNNIMKDMEKFEEDPEDEDSGPLIQ